jgi:predicted patatin/cPLA2 family phospholipase
MIKQSLSITGPNALVVEGGAIRSIFSAGILDAFLANNFNPFDLYIGVSAGASNLAFFLSGLEGGAYQAYLNSVNNPQFINTTRFILGGDLLDMDWLFNCEISLEMQHILNEMTDKNFLVGMTEVATGRNIFHKGINNELLMALKASMSLPLLYREFPCYRGSLMTDGGIANGIPVDEAIRLGAKKIMVIRSRHKDYVKTDSLFHKYVRFKLKRYPELHRVMLQRINIHERTRKLIASPPAGVSIIDITPPIEFRLPRFSKNSRQIENGYKLGIKMASQAIQQWIESDPT